MDSPQQDPQNSINIEFGFYSNYLLNLMAMDLLHKTLLFSPLKAIQLLTLALNIDHICLNIHANSIPFLNQPKQRRKVTTCQIEADPNFSFILCQQLLVSSRKVNPQINEFIQVAKDVRSFSVTTRFVVT